MDETARRFPAWCWEAYRVGDAFVVKDELGRYWRAYQGFVTYSGQGFSGYRVVDLLIPRFGPCEKMSDVLLTGL